MLEVCVDSFDSAWAAFHGGAKRIELCSALSEGGLTPTVGQLLVIQQQLPKLTVFCTLRPRGGSDFHYHKCEIRSVLHDIDRLRRAGADGFVFGALLECRRIDAGTCKRIVRRAAPRPVTFSRAIDVTDPRFLLDATGALEQIALCGFQRVLTSGLAATVELGAERIRMMVEECKRTANGLIVIAGGGLTPENAGALMDRTGCTELHATARGCSKWGDGGAEKEAEADASLSVHNGVDFGRSRYTQQATVAHLLAVMAVHTKHECCDQCTRRKEAK